ncbi:pyridoxal phosphate-dependent transferase [Tricharina praecox]|uniref:pyridoxal phosphate-dependent transferase n=1 Tax=Tricharina praecox TaxID=43433 RepID=UPI0022212A20|nr:pyridoxal phosphate-dependent transferase [Tricharina praecox]KAI5850875.1 pyridoxal phosphate-dependent transferase [Tricharina praecox]
MQLRGCSKQPRFPRCHPYSSPGRLYRMQLPTTPTDDSSRIQMSKLTLVTSPSNSSAAERKPRLDLLRGHPSTRLLPTHAIYEAAGVALNSPSLLPQDSYAENRHPLAYGADNGNANVREEIGRWCAERYRLREAIPLERIFLTNGASYGLQTALSLFTSPVTGYTKCAFVLSPTYFLAGRTFEDAGFASRIVAVRTTRTSLDFDGLLAQLRRVDAERPDVSLEEGLRPLLRGGAPQAAKRLFKFVLYCVPTYSNPTGETMDLDSRRRLVQIAREWDMLIICDDVYDFLGNDDQPAVPPMRLVSIDAETLPRDKPEGETGNTISNCSFSKLVGPGLRAGWIESATGVLAKQLGDGGANHSGGCPSQFTSTLLYPLLLPLSARNPVRKIDSIISTLTLAYTLRCGALVAAIHEFLPAGTEVWGGRGGFFVWVGLPKELDAWEIVRLAAAYEGLVVASGGMSECPGEGNALGWADRWLRIAVSYCEEEELVEGVKRLARAVDRWREGERAVKSDVEVK